MQESFCQEDVVTSSDTGFWDKGYCQGKIVRTGSELKVLEAMTVLEITGQLMCRIN